MTCCCCSVLAPPSPAIDSHIHRYHGSSIVDFDSVRGGISLETEKTETGTTSRLLLTRATLRDSGNYSCVPAAAISASIQVHVLNGERSPTAVLNMFKMWHSVIISGRPIHPPKRMETPTASQGRVLVQWFDGGLDGGLAGLLSRVLHKVSKLRCGMCSTACKHRSNNWAFFFRVSSMDEWRRIAASRAIANEPAKRFPMALPLLVLLYR